MKFFTRFLIPIVLIAGLYYVFTHHPTGDGSVVDKVLQVVHGTVDDSSDPLKAITGQAEKASADHAERMKKIEGDMYGE